MNLPRFVTFATRQGVRPKTCRVCTNPIGLLAIYGNECNNIPSALRDDCDMQRISQCKTDTNIFLIASDTEGIHLVARYIEECWKLSEKQKILLVKNVIVVILLSSF